MAHFPSSSRLLAVHPIQPRPLHCFDECTDRPGGLVESGLLENLNSKMGVLSIVLDVRTNSYLMNQIYFIEVSIIQKIVSI